MEVWEIVCQDGQVRHDRPFANKREAEYWAHWGHCCLADHTYRVVKDEEEN